MDGWFASIASRTAAATKAAATTAATTATPVAAAAVSTSSATTAATRATRTRWLGRAGAVESFGYAAVTGTETSGCATWAVAAVVAARAALGHQIHAGAHGVGLSARTAGWTGCAAGHAATTAAAIAISARGVVVQWWLFIKVHKIIAWLGWTRAAMALAVTVTAWWSAA